MVPTIDISNIIKKAVYAALSAFSSPIVACIAFAAAVSAIVASIVTYFTSSSFYPDGVFNSVDNLLAQGSLWSTVGYVVAADVAVKVARHFITTINWMVVFLPTMFVAVHAAAAILETVYASRQTVKDVAA